MKKVRYKEQHTSSSKGMVSASQNLPHIKWTAVGQEGGSRVLQGGREASTCAGLLMSDRVDGSCGGVPSRDMRSEPLGPATRDPLRSKHIRKQAVLCTFSHPTSDLTTCQWTIYSCPLMLMSQKLPWGWVIKHLVVLDSREYRNATRQTHTARAAAAVA
jgi:hypothetical protein